MSEEVKPTPEQIIVHNLLCRQVEAVQGHKGIMRVPVEDFAIGDPRCKCGGR